MEFWDRLQVNGALQRLGKRIAANPSLWQMASDGRPHFDHWVEECASDDDLVRAADVVEDSLVQIASCYQERRSGQQLATILQGSMRCAAREMRRRGLARGESGQVAGARPASREGSDAKAASQPSIDLIQEALEQQQKTFAGPLRSQKGRLRVRLAGSFDENFEFHKSGVPGVDLALEDPSNVRITALRYRVMSSHVMMAPPHAQTLKWATLVVLAAVGCWTAGHFPCPSNPPGPYMPALLFWGVAKVNLELLLDLPVTNLRGPNIKVTDRRGRRVALFVSWGIAALGLYLAARVLPGTCGG